MGRYSGRWVGHGRDGWGARVMGRNSGRWGERLWDGGWGAGVIGKGTFFLDHDVCRNS